MSNIDPRMVKWEEDSPKIDPRMVKWEDAPQEQFAQNRPADVAEKIAALPATRFAVGAARPILGAAQLSANLAPVSGAGLLSAIVKRFGGSGIGESIDNSLTQMEQMKNKGMGDIEGTALSQLFSPSPVSLGGLASMALDKSGLLQGADVAGFIGEMASPANLMLASAPMKAGTMARIGQGAKIGALGGASQPITGGQGAEEYLGSKAIQTGLGAASGAVLSPVLGKVADKVVSRFIKPSQQAIGGKVDQTIKEALAETGQSIDDIPQGTLSNLRAEVAKAFMANQDPRAAMRQADFEKLGLKGTLGQVGRDPMQFASEFNLKSVQGVGDPLRQRLQEQNRVLGEKIGQFAQGADEAYPAGQVIASDLASVAKARDQAVSQLYQQARQSAGKDLNVPLTGLAQDYADVLSRFGDNVPNGVRNQFGALGLDPLGKMKQQRVFTVESADELLKVINQNDPGFTNKPMSTALGELRKAVKNAVNEVDDSGGVFAPAVKAAKENFALKEAIPALEAAQRGSIPAEKFVQRYVIDAPADQVVQMSKVMGDQARQQARAQIGSYLENAAFGQNVAGDRGISQAGFNKALAKIPKQKLEAFFSPEEIDMMKTAGRVSAYIQQEPFGATPNRSGTAAALANLVGKIPLAGKLNSLVGIAQNIRNAAGNYNAVNNALSARLPTIPNPRQIAIAGGLLSPAAFISGNLAGSVVSPSVVADNP